MKINKIIIGCVALMLFATACDDQLEIVPKGKTTLEKINDLELLFNQEWSLQLEPGDDLGVICNESVGVTYIVPEELNKTNTLGKAYLAFDESIDRALLTVTDTRYETVYKYINYMNVILEKIDDAEGEEGKKKAIVAEARILRAYFHWLLVNIYAQQYDAATAKEKGGIAYVDETDVTVQKEKLTLEETYQCILNDCTDEVIDALPVTTDNVFRANKAFGYAVRAKVLMQMKRYSEALPYAQKALSINGKIEDRSVIMQTMSWQIPYNSPNNYLYIMGMVRMNPGMEVLSPESSKLFESGDYVVNYDLMGGWSEDFAFMFAGVSNCKMYFGWDACCNAYGITSDRMYYVAAECLIRTGEIRKGLELVDKVRFYRVENYEPYVDRFDQQTLSEEEAMALMQKAKWIECVGSYENFFDCKRWNTEAKYKRTITRNMGELGTFTITPDSPLWIFPFPTNAIRHNSSLTQNY